MRISRALPAATFLAIVATVAGGPAAFLAPVLAPLADVGRVMSSAHADPVATPGTLPGGARDVVGIDAAPAGPAITVHLSNGAADVLRPCRYEDGRHCYWDAGTSGNGRGHDFVVTRGRVHYVASIPRG